MPREVPLEYTRAGGHRSGVVFGPGGYKWVPVDYINRDIR